MRLLHRELTEDQKTRVIRLLKAWGIFDRPSMDYWFISSATGQITQSPMYQAQRDNIQESADSAKARYIQPYSDECLNYVRGIIYNDLAKKYHKVIIARYRWSEAKQTIEKCKIIHTNKTTFYRRLDRAHEIVNYCMRWGLAE